MAAVAEIPRIRRSFREEMTSFDRLVWVAHSVHPDKQNVRLSFSGNQIVFEELLSIQDR